jgi:hypothetical protein
VLNLTDKEDQQHSGSAKHERPKWEIQTPIDKKSKSVQNLLSYSNSDAKLGQSKDFSRQKFLSAY